ncbi:hypothetical protein KAFR_0A05750 [Kazachstania africana CBS 2517]|uniref:Uncharacterized protein n=1 Tax=Kazachstania africana (strain ATCC 22294 / BCRC 22015 / CBS 2517 / CECT 1963 / NBRC 1671 / NRRL Y-8276) TaxID=1071382 RepID=H2ANR0_KAZAF|nr:hypothetical protein KAFR_0A05750 [Kazachstania africana CBS 2517]CCF56010.1 hypothetical protein KAFR_0A05750 [Kazachstania africana CBS 2517]
MSNFFSLLLTAICSFAALILACIACAGSTKNYSPINKIYAAQINLSELNTSTVLGSATISEISDILPSYINIGLWSYCIEDSSKAVTSCTSPSGIQNFNLEDLIYDNIEDNNVLSTIDSIADIILPEKLQTELGYYNRIIKCMFITLLIGIVTSFLCIVLTFLRCIIHLTLIKVFGVCMALIAFFSLLISAATGLGTYIFIRHILNNNYSDYGISLSLGLNYFALAWAAVVAALLNIFAWSFVIRRRQVQMYAAPIEKRPLL